jgi:hypothetical protein
MIHRNLLVSCSLDVALTTNVLPNATGKSPKQSFTTGRNGSGPAGSGLGRALRPPVGPTPNHSPSKFVALWPTLKLVANPESA